MEIPNVQLVKTRCPACKRVSTTVESTQITRAFIPVLDCYSCRTAFWSRASRLGNVVNGGPIDGEIIGTIRNTEY
jgi:uncharacterized protein with PIN domain